MGCVETCPILRLHPTHIVFRVQPQIGTRIRSRKWKVQSGKKNLELHSLSTFHFSLLLTLTMHLLAAKPAPDGLAALAGRFAFCSKTSQSHFRAVPNAHGWQRLAWKARSDWLEPPRIDERSADSRIERFLCARSPPGINTKVISY